MFDALFTPERVLAELSDRAFVQAMLDAERALARAEAAVGAIPVSAADEIARACDAALYDADRIAVEARSAGNPAEPLVRALRAQVGGEAAAHVHLGATSQDIVDTASMLVARRVLPLLLEDIDAIAAACAALARTHRATPMAARTLQQQALPTTFGLKAAGWLVGVLEARRLVVAADGRLAVQLGGAAGTLAALGEHGPAVVAGMAHELGLAEPTLPWHTDRARVAELGAALLAITNAIAKVAGDIVLLAQTEVAEVAEPLDGRGGSSTLPHKRNPVGSTLALANARRVEAHVSLLTGGGPHEHERAAGAWHAEWDGLEGALAACTGAADSMRGVLEGLAVRPGQMRRNLDLTRGLIMAERVETLCAERIGRAEAKRIVTGAARAATEGGVPFGEVLDADPDVPLTPDEIAAALDPLGYLGSAGLFVDRALALYSESAPSG
jgi:3-carboxy-cis,cis-muconate cycloisomerase